MKASLLHKLGCGKLQIPDSKRGFEMLDVPANFKSDLADRLHQLVTQGYVLPSTAPFDYSFPTARVSVPTYDSGGTVQQPHAGGHLNGELARHFK